MKWITRRDVKVDRLACPWLIKRFVDPHGGVLVWQSSLIIAGLDAPSKQSSGIA
jgi:hypothetical protein